MMARLFLLLVIISQTQSQGIISYIPGMSYFFPDPDQSPALREDAIALPDPPHYQDSPELLINHQHHQDQDPYPHVPQYHHQPEQLTEYHHQPEQQTEYHHQPEQLTEYHQVPHQPSPSYDDCFDEHTRYGKVQYNTSLTQQCTYSLDRICYPKSEVLCLDVPMTECKLEAGYTCHNEEKNNTLRCDTTVTKYFTAKDCVQDRFETLKKIQKTPECKNVTKVNCDSRWIINEQGEKVFDKNQNCRDYTWEKCELVDKLVDETEVPVHTCTDRDLTYLVPEVMEEEVTSYSKECDTMAGAVCDVFSTTECTTVEWTDCEEVIRPHCETFTVNIPYQEMIKYHRCNVDKNTEQLPQEDTYHHQPQPEQFIEYQPQPEQLIEFHPLPEQMTEYHHQPAEIIPENHHQPEYQPQPQMTEYQPEYQPPTEYHHEPQENTYHHQPEQDTRYGYHNMPLAPAHLGQHPNTEYSGPITSYHHPSIDM